MLKTVYIKTYGCQMNERDSDALAATLTLKGYEIVHSEREANIILLNTCSIRELAELKAIGKSNIVARNNQKIVGILGCMAQNLGEQLQKLSPRTALIVGPSNLHKVPEYLDEIIDGEKTSICDLSVSEINEPLVSCHNHKTAKASAFVSIMQGCNMCCSYCIVPKTRGPEKYRSMEDIVNEIQSLAEHGVKEVTLLGQIVNRYGIGQMPNIEGKSPFVQLLEKIENIENIRRIRFMSPHPTGFKADLIDAYKNLSKLCPYVHLPAQSGSNSILHTMKRPYTRESFLSIVEGLRKNVPTISLSTDIIVGFPGETEEDFQLTHSLFDEAQFDMAFIFKYSPRPGTPAAILDDQIPDSIKELRNQILLQKLEKYSIQYNNRMLGTTREVLVEGSAKRGDNKFFGRTPEHKKVIFEGTEHLIGQLIPVHLESCTVSTLFGKII